MIKLIKKVQDRLFLVNWDEVTNIPQLALNIAGQILRLTGFCFLK